MEKLPLREQNFLNGNKEIDIINLPDALNIYKKHYEELYSNTLATNIEKFLSEQLSQYNTTKKNIKSINEYLQLGDNEGIRRDHPYAGPIFFELKNEFQEIKLDGGRRRKSRRSRKNKRSRRRSYRR